MFRRTLLFSSSRQKAAPWHYYSGLILQFFFYFELHFGLDGGLWVFLLWGRGRSKVPGVGCSLSSLQPWAQTDRQGADPFTTGLIPIFGGMLVRGLLPHLPFFSIAMPSPKGRKVPQVPAFAFRRNWSPECDNRRDVLPRRCCSLGRVQSCTPHPAEKSQWELWVPEEHRQGLPPSH